MDQVREGISLYIMNSGGILLNVTRAGVPVNAIVYNESTRASRDSVRSSRFILSSLCSELPPNAVHLNLNPRYINSAIVPKTDTNATGVNHTLSPCISPIAFCMVA